MNKVERVKERLKLNYFQEYDGIGQGGFDEGKAMSDISWLLDEVVLFESRINKLESEKTVLEQRFRNIINTSNKMYSIALDLQIALRKIKLMPSQAASIARDALIASERE